MQRWRKAGGGGEYQNAAVTGVEDLTSAHGDSSLSKYDSGREALKTYLLGEGVDEAPVDDDDGVSKGCGGGGESEFVSGVVSSSNVCDSEFARPSSGRSRGGGAGARVIASALWRRPNGEGGTDTCDCTATAGDGAYGDGTYGDGAYGDGVYGCK